MIWSALCVRKWPRLSIRRCGGCRFSPSRAVVFVLGQLIWLLRKECLSMEHWQQEALQALLTTEVKHVEDGTRVYVSSKTYGDSRFHLLSKRYDGVQLEQTNIDEKWGSRVVLQADELPAVLKTLLSWYLEESARSATQS